MDSDDDDDVDHGMLMMMANKLPALIDTSLTVGKLVVALQNNLHKINTINNIIINIVIIVLLLVVIIIIQCHFSTWVLFGGIAPTVALNLHIKTN